MRDWSHDEAHTSHSPEVCARAARVSSGQKATGSQTDEQGAEREFSSQVAVMWKLRGLQPPPRGETRAILEVLGPGRGALGSLVSSPPYTKSR